MSKTKTEKYNQKHSELTKVKTFRYFNVMYVIALSTIALVTIFSQFLIQSFLDNQIDDSHVINVAGRQRMLSQKITKISLLLGDEPKNEFLIKELEQNLRTWKACHYGLQNGDDRLALPKPSNDLVINEFKELEPYFLDIYQNATRLLSMSRRDVSPNMEVIEKCLQGIRLNEYKFLQIMDEIVNTYDKEAQQKVSDLKRIEYFLVAFVLLTLLFEVFFIFQPVAVRMKKVINQFITAESQATDTAHELNKVNKGLNISIRQNKDFNFALKKATVLIRTDKDGVIKSANDKYCVITKYTENELIGKQLFFNNKGEEESVIYEHIRDDKSNVNVWQGEILDQAKDGANFWRDVNMIPIVDDNGVLYEYMVICSNITARKEAEIRLKELMESKLERQKQDQRLISYSIISGQENERKRVAIEMHDGVGQMLTALKFQAEALVPENQQQEESFQNVHKLIYQTIKEVRRISSDILPQALSDFGLGSAIKELVQGLNKDAAIKIQFRDSSRLPERLNKQIEVSLYRIVQEAINNSLKHSNANLIQVTLKSDDEFLYLSIKDDGIGFDASSFFMKRKGKNLGNGLRNMRERAQLINAELAFNAIPKLGVMISIELPLTLESYD